MALSNDLIMQFVKATKDDTKTKKETTVYGTIVEHNGSKFVRLDGAETPTPISSTATANVGERVTVLIKDHSAIITGNLSSPSARNDDVKDAIDEISEFEIAIGNKVDTEELEAEKARIDSLVAENVTIKGMISASDANIENIVSDTVTINKKLNANSADIESLKTTKLDASTAVVQYAKITDLEATNTNVYNLQATYSEFEKSTTNELVAVTAEIENLGTKYANIDFSNIGQAAMEYFYAQSGLIENVTISNGTITGNLVGVTIKGDIIEGNTVIADKLVIQGEDGLYYKLNTDGVKVSEEQTEYNSLNGQIILAKSVTAEKVNVDDLVAFDATIGGFNITENSIYSEVKDSEGNSTRGIYMDTDGQVNFGDADKFIKYYRDEDGNYHLAISADTVLYSIDGIQKSIADLGIIGEYVQISTYEGEPCVELGESDSEFKLVITNTRIMFMEGTGVPAYVSNQSLFIKKAVIEEELQQGGFLWKSRSNRNLGVVWKGVTS